MMTTDNTDLLLEQMERLSDVLVDSPRRTGSDDQTYGAELLDLEVGAVEFVETDRREHRCLRGKVLIGWGEVLLMDGALTVRLADLRNAHSESSGRGRKRKGNRKEKADAGE